MSAQENAGEKTHEATPRRLEKAREEGELPRSQDAQTFAAYLGFAAAVLLAGDWAVLRLGETLMPMLAQPEALAPLIFESGADGLGALMLRIGAPVALVLAVPAAAVLALLVAQRGIVFVPARALPKLSRLSPIENARSKYGTRGLVEFAKSTVKLSALVAVLALVLWTDAHRIPQFGWTDARATGAILDQQYRHVMAGVLVVAGLVAAFDLIWQRLDHLRRMRMSHQELKEEGKQAEGDPHMRAERRERARQIANNRMLLKVPEADVVIANPVHYAVALKWSRSQDRAPVCLAKGVDEIALAIRARAVEAGVPVHVDPPAARSIHGLVEIGHEIRPEHYQAVAAAILFADEMRRRARRDGR